MTNRLRVVFATSSVVFLVVLAAAPLKNALREYHGYQRDYRKLAAERAPSARLARAVASRPDRIEQIWNPGFGNRVDRCVTCHQGVSEPTLAGAPAPFGFHSETAHTPVDFDQFGCVFCHGGQGRATTADEAHGLTRHWPTPLLPSVYLEASCGRCHRGAQVSEAPRLSKGRQLMERYACYSCHLARGYEAYTADAPSLSATSLKLRASWVRAWLKDPKALNANARMPRFRIEPGETDALINYLFSRPPAVELASRIEAAATEPPGDAAKGEVLFRESRCISCHTVEGKGNDSAPELSLVGSKASRAWLLAFVRDPSAFNPRTPMPAFDFKPEEARDIAAYLSEELRDFSEPAQQESPFQPNQRLAEEGRKVFLKYGCFGCHPMEGVSGQEKIGPELSALADKKVSSLDFGRRSDLPKTLAAWVGAKVTEPSSFAPGLKMPTFSLQTDEVTSVVTALLSLSGEAVPDEYQPRSASPNRVTAVPAGDVGRLFDRYRCLSCHIVGASGGDISTAPLTFEGSKVNRDWLERYLLTPYTIRGILPERMPFFRMKAEDAKRIADYIADVFLDDAIPSDAFGGRPPAPEEIAAGERTYSRLGCNSCHILGQAGGYYGPPLSDAGDRLKSGWIAYWLENPQRWRADVRCPNYGLSREQVVELTAFVSTRHKIAADPAAGSQ